MSRSLLSVSLGLLACCSGDFDGFSYADSAGAGVGHTIDNPVTAGRGGMGAGAGASAGGASVVAADAGGQSSAAGTGSTAGEGSYVPAAGAGAGQGPRAGDAPQAGSAAGVAAAAVGGTGPMAGATPAGDASAAGSGDDPDAGGSETPVGGQGSDGGGAGVAEDAGMSVDAGPGSLGGEGGMAPVDAGGARDAAGGSDAGAADGGGVRELACREELAPLGGAPACTACSCEACLEEVEGCLGDLCGAAVACAVQQGCQFWDCYCSTRSCGRAAGRGDGPCVDEFEAAAGGGQVAVFATWDSSYTTLPLVRARQLVACALWLLATPGQSAITGQCEAQCRDD